MPARARPTQHNRSQGALCIMLPQTCPERAGRGLPWRRCSGCKSMRVSGISFVSLHIILRSPTPRCHAHLKGEDPLHCVTSPGTKAAFPGSQSPVLVYIDNREWCTLAVSSPLCCPSTCHRHVHETCSNSVSLEVLPLLQDLSRL